MQPDPSPRWPSPATVPPAPGAVAAPLAPVSVCPHRGPARAVLATARPRQWVKNALVIAAAGAGGALGRDDVLVRVGLAALAFCLLSAGVYALNDVRDVAEDRLHPRKRHRPVAAGELSIPAAVALGTLWLLVGLGVCAAISWSLGAVGLGYVLLTLSYSWLWRRVLVADLVAIAGGFVLRALAGGVAAPVTPSRWFVLVVSCVALFVAAGKRHAELARSARQLVGGAHAAGRRVLRRYTPRTLRMVLSASGAGALFAYYVWAFEVLDTDDVPWRLLTAVPFTVALVRYGALVLAGDGEAPEETVLSDRLLLVVGLVWVALFALAVHDTG